MNPAALDVPAPAADNVTPEPRQLTNQDRCDACGAQAYVEVNIASSTLDENFKRKEVPLLFCAHHYNKHEPRLVMSSAVRGISVDEREAFWERERNRTRGYE
ncbi:hypothetical protein ACFVAJ_16765 [Agromyces sp. NPDC057679]|uniref:DUF7455 domain-containing protein n=1 Tax=Agromyces sp. NPDC057679 TaxID=3346207 RepID=UPI00366BE4CF